MIRAIVIDSKMTGNKMSFKELSDKSPTVLKGLLGYSKDHHLIIDHATYLEWKGTELLQERNPHVVCDVPCHTLDRHVRFITLEKLDDILDIFKGQCPSDALILVTDELIERVKRRVDYWLRVTLYTQTQFNLNPPVNPMFSFPLKYSPEEDSVPYIAHWRMDAVEDPPEENGFSELEDDLRLGNTYCNDVNFIIISEIYYSSSMNNTIVKYKISPVGPRPLTGYKVENNELPIEEFINLISSYSEL